VKVDAATGRLVPDYATGATYYEAFKTGTEPTHFEEPENFEGMEEYQNNKLPQQDNIDNEAEEPDHILLPNASQQHFETD